MKRRAVALQPTAPELGIPPRDQTASRPSNSAGTSLIRHHDRRIVALISLAVAFGGAAALTALAWLGLVTPSVLLALCFAIGSGMALMGPAWQSSVSEQVPPETLPAAVALNGISYNIARSVSPPMAVLLLRRPAEWRPLRLTPCFTYR